MKQISIGDPEPSALKPSITFEVSSGYTFQDSRVQIGSTVKIGTVVTHSINLKSFKITRVFNGASTEVLLDSTISGNTKTLNYTLNNTIAALPTAKGTYEYTISCTDKDATTETKKITVTAYGPLSDRGSGYKVYSIKASGAGLFSAFDLLTGDEISAASGNGNEALRDIVDNSSSSTLSGSWTAQNGTRFKVGTNSKINNKTFLQFLNEDDVKAAWDAAGAEQQTITVDLNSKNIVIAKVVRGGTPQYMLISITDFVDDAGSNGDYIEFQYKQ